MYKGFMHCTMNLSVNEAKLVCASGTGLLLGEKSTGPFEEQGPRPETVDSFFRYYHVKHGSLGSTLFLYLNAEMPSQ